MTEVSMTHPFEQDMEIITTDMYQVLMIPRFKVYIGKARQLVI